MLKSVILDTDLGTDIDDSWALGMLMNCSDLSVKLVLTATADTVYRAAVAAKHLTEFGRDDVPVGIGTAVDDPRHKFSLLDWLDGFSVDDYKGPLYRDGISRLIEIVEEEDEVTILAIAPMTNVAEFCRRRPDLVGKCNIIAMSGSVYAGYQVGQGPTAEWNVKVDIPAAKAVFKAPWKSFTITPLDHCGDLVLRGELYQRLLDSPSPVVQSILSAYQSWSLVNEVPDWPANRTSVLFDTAAVHLACTREDSVIKTLGIGIRDDGTMSVGESDGTPVDCALDWVSKEKYLEHLVNVLLKQPLPREGMSC